MLSFFDHRNDGFKNKIFLRDADLAFRIDPTTNYETTNLFIVYPLYLFFSERKYVVHNI